MELLFILIFISNLLSIIVGEDQYIAIPFDSKPITINVTNQDNIFLYFTLEFDFLFPLYPTLYINTNFEYNNMRNFLTVCSYSSPHSCVNPSSFDEYTFQQKKEGQYLSFATKSIKSTSKSIIKLILHNNEQKELIIYRNYGTSISTISFIIIIIIIILLCSLFLKRSIIFGKIYTVKRKK